MGVETIVEAIGSEAAGAFNLTAPNPATNAEFTDTLLRLALHAQGALALPDLIDHITDRLAWGQSASDG